MDRPLLAISTGVVLASLIFLASLLPQGTRRLGPIENIRGIPYPRLAKEQILITEHLAHADVYLKEPALAKQLLLEIDYDSGNTTSLFVGVREDSFWQSYGSRVPLNREESKARIVIPLTDKLQETDRSLDLMFFAEANDDPLWEISSLRASVQYSVPNWPEFKNYVRGILYRERAL